MKAEEVVNQIFNGIDDSLYDREEAIELIKQSKINDIKNVVRDISYGNEHGLLQHFSGDFVNLDHYLQDNYEEL